MRCAHTVAPIDPCMDRLWITIVVTMTPGLSQLRLHQWNLDEN
jgi:hypothetical protein